MDQPPRFRPLRHGLAVLGLLALVTSCSSSPSQPATSDSPAPTTSGSASAAVLQTMSAVPTLELVARTADSYPFNAADHAREPLDLASYGFVEEEYFVSGNANVYTLTDGTLAVEKADVPYVNRILVRRPADPADASGSVLVDIYNASNGYDIEDMWRRLYSNILLAGHTYIGVTSKPINVDALRNFDPARYERLTWYDEPVDTCAQRGPVDFAALGPFGEVPCTETGLVWDILTQVGNAVRDPQAAEQILGGAELTSLILMGQSQSGLYLNTYVNNFHDAVKASNGGQPLFDGYLTAAGNWMERSIRDGEFQNGGSSEDNSLASVPGPDTPVDIDVPWLIVDSEADTALFPQEATVERPLADQTRVWQVVGTGHTYSMSPVVPDNAELVKAGRPERVFPEVYTPFPMEPAFFAATQALVDAHQDGSTLPATRWFERDASGALVRDDHGNVRGGLRYGMIELPIAEFLGFTQPGDMNGVANPITVEEFRQNWTDRADYLAQMAEVDAGLIEDGYLTPDGEQLLVERANVVLDRIGVD